MKWYTCLNEEGLEAYADHLRAAITSARAVTDLDPHVVFDGEPARLRQVLGRLDITIHRRRSSLWPAIIARGEGPGYKHRIAGGAFLRLEIPLIETSDEFVLYTDCDVIFTASPQVADAKPGLIAAAPEHDKDDWSYFNSGVLLINVPALRAEYDAVVKTALGKIGVPHFYDQGVYNLAFADRWDRLSLEDHWKPYWGWSNDARIIHFHGPKLRALRYLIRGGEPTIIHDVWRTLYDQNRDAYEMYFEMLDAYAAPRI